MSSSTHVETRRAGERARSGRGAALLPADGAAAGRRGRRGRAGGGVQGARRPGPAAADVDDRVGAGRRDLRLRPHPGVRGVRVHDLAPPEDAAGGRSGRRRAPGQLGLLPAPPRPDAPARDPAHARRGRPGRAVASHRSLVNSVATALALGALILTFGPVSGAHFNPVVSAADRLLGRRARTGLTATGLTATGLAGYTVAQIAGAIGGSRLSVRSATRSGRGSRRFWPTSGRRAA